MSFRLVAALQAVRDLRVIRLGPGARGRDGLRAGTDIKVGSRRERMARVGVREDMEDMEDMVDTVDTVDPVGSKTEVTTGLYERAIEEEIS